MVMRMKRFEGQSVLITGASSGIGEALARELAAEGASLCLLARREDRLAKLASELERGGTRVVVEKGDVNEDGAVERAVASAVRAFGKLDVGIANAGFGVVGRFDALTLEDYRRQFETNVFGLIRTAHACLPELKRTRGRLVLMGSVAGHVALPGASAYAMSKFAVRALGGALDGELRTDGVSVTLISPGFVSTEIRKVNNQGALHAEAKDPIPEWLRMSVETAARQMVRAIARRKREAIITGHGKLIVAVQRFFPFVFIWMGRRGVSGRPEPTDGVTRDRHPAGRGAGLR
jgi:short-subunit dehydrogenase